MPPKLEKGKAIGLLEKRKRKDLNKSVRLVENIMLTKLINKNNGNESEIGWNGATEMVMK